MPRIRSINVLSSIVLFHSFAICSVIVLLAHPAKVVRTVVQCVAVHVIHGGAALRVRVGAPRLSHQSADKKMPAFTVSAKTDTLITFIVHERRQKPRLGPFETFDAPTGTD